MKRIIKYLLILTLAFVGVFLFALMANAVTPEFRADDEQQKIILTTSMPTYNGSAGYAFYTLGYILNITSGSTSKTVFLEGEDDYRGFTYSVIINEFNTEHGSAGKTLAENYFNNYSGTMTLNTVFTLFQKGDVYNKTTYGDYRVMAGGVWGYLQAKINDTSNAATPTKEVSYASLSSNMKAFPVKFWTWSSKSYCWSYYATYMNNTKTSLYTLSPSTFTSSTVQNYSAPNYATDWQNAAMLCEFTQNSVYATREYYKRTITRVNSMNFKVSQMQAPASFTDSGQVTVLYSNDHFNRGVQTVLTNLTLTNGNSIDYYLDLDTNNYSGCYLTYNVYGYSPGTQILTASINGGTNGPHSYAETNYTDNVKTASISVSTSKDFGVWGLSIPSGKVYENNTISLTVNWTNYKSGTYTNIPGEIYFGGTLVYTDYLSFNGYGTITKTYSLNVGSGTGSKQIVAWINWANHLSESDPNDNQSLMSVLVNEYYEFSISDLLVSPTCIYQNQAVNVSFRTDSWNQTKAYTNIPVEVLYDGAVIYTEQVNFTAYGVNYHSLNLNVGSSIGNHTITARINWPNHYNEVNPNNNLTTSQIINVMAATNLQIEPVSTYGNYREDTDVISTFRVKNINSIDITPDKNLKVSLNVSYTGGNVSVPIKTGVIIPANSDNIVYFKWHVPNGTAGKVFKLTATVNSDNAIAEVDTGDNSVTINKTIISENISVSPDTQFEKSMPQDFTVVSPPTISQSNTASWSEWIYSGGSFIKQTYGLSLNISSFGIIPDKNSPSAKNQNGNWSMGSGYGYSALLNASIGGLNDTIMPPSTACTNAQTGSILVPEYKYSSAKDSYCSLESSAINSFQLPENPNAENSGRLHFIPLWYPDGNYITQGTVSDLWTPAGMLTAYANSNNINIVNSAYDDWYIGR